jgi:cullin-associated NEDD8-dissociated protein 1
MALPLGHAGANSSYVATLLPKLRDEDPDLRYMALNDLCLALTTASSNIFLNDMQTARRTAEAIVSALQDTNGEVQNQALKVIPPFVTKAHEGVVSLLIENLAALPSTDDSLDASIPAMGLRSVVLSLPHPIPGGQKSKAIQSAYSVVSRSLIPRLLGYVVNPHGVMAQRLPPGLLQLDMEKGSDNNSVDILLEVARCFGSLLQEPEVNALSKTALTMSQSQSTTPAVKKKAVNAIAHLSQFWTESMLEQFIAHIQDHFSGHPDQTQKKLLFNLVASTIRAIPSKIEQHLSQLVPFVLETLSQEEFDNSIARWEETAEHDLDGEELREAALQTLESSLAFCAAGMKPFTLAVVEVIRRFLKYDPNLVQDDDEELDDDEPFLDEDDEFEQDDAAIDEDDVSWKVRKSSAKVATVLISTRSNGDLLEDGTLYNQLAPSLISRFQEREETVRLEVLEALSLLIRITGGEPAENMTGSLVPSSPTTMGPPLTRKRRRVGSDASMMDTGTSISLSIGYPLVQNALPSSTAFSSLEAVSGQIVQGLLSLIQNNSLPTKLRAISTLKDLVAALHGNLTNYLPGAVPIVLETVQKSSSSAGLAGASLTTANECRIESLMFLGVVAEVQSSKDLVPYASSIVKALRTAMRHKFARISSAALGCAGSYIDAMTPPRSADKQYQGPLVDLTTGLLEVISATEVDLDVRRLAILSLGMLLGRSAQVPDLLPKPQREAGMEAILQRLRNETTRLASVRAVETVGMFAKNGSDFPPSWVPQVSAELVEQFRKASRSLRGNSLSAMKALATNPASAGQFSPNFISQFVPTLEPVLAKKDLHTATPALLILAAFVRIDAGNKALQEILDPVCELLTLSLPRGTLNALIRLVRAYGTHGVGKDLMSKLLRKYSLKATPDVAGKVIGNLLASGPGTFGNISLDSFIGEVNSQNDQQRKCLALCILGEVAGLEGSKCSLTPKFFMDRFGESDGNTAQAAATALGRAAVGNIPVYLQVILTALEEDSLSSKRRQLLLHTILEIVSIDDPVELASHVQTLWSHVMTTAQGEENRSVGSECLGRLAILDPGTFFPQLRSLLEDTSSNGGLRGLVLAALRAAITSDSSAAHTLTVGSLLHSCYTTVLQIIPDEPDLDNRRLGLTIINAAMHSRFGELVLPAMRETISVVLHEMRIRKELVKEVSMGPFKHKVDDGLDIRKVCYTGPAILRC